MTVPLPTASAWLHTARLAADAATAVHLAHAGRVGVGDLRRKGEADYVSRVDEEAQEAALACILGRHPDHAVLAEEEGSGAGGAAEGQPLWVVDPLDGTTNYLHGHPMYAASVAVALDGRVVAGAVACGPSGERWWAARGLGAFKNGVRLRTSAPAGLRDALVGTGFPFKRLDRARVYAEQLTAVLGASGGVRRGGAAALDLCYLAEGRFDAFWELFLNPWDYAAGVVIVEEAGGWLERVEGGPLDLDPGSVLGGADEATAQALRQVLAPTEDGPGS